MHWCVSAALLTCAAIVLPATASPTVVYDNTITPTAGPFVPDGFVAFNRYDAGGPMGDELIGDEVILAGTARYITEFHLLLSSSEPVELDVLTLTFRNRDGIVWNWGGYPYGPGTEIWTGTRTNVAVDGPTTVVFDVPHVLVTDELIWMACADSGLAGPALYDPPGIGSTPDYIPDCFWDIDSTNLDIYGMDFLEDPMANFGAKIFADTVPEPATAGLLLLGGVAICRRCRRRA